MTDTPPPEEPAAPEEEAPAEEPADEADSEVFVSEPSSINATPDQTMSVQDGLVPGEGFEEKTMTVHAVQMNMGFDANGQPGNAGDWLCCVNGHWFIAKGL